MNHVSRPVPGVGRRAVVRAFATGLLALVAWLGLPGAAQAQQANCTATVSTLEFGRPGSNPTAQVDVTANLRIACTGNSGARGKTLKVCVGFPDGTRQMTSTSGGTLGYQIYYDAARSLAWGTRASGNTPENLRIEFNQADPPTGELTVPIYGRIPAGQSGLPPGDYSATLSAEVTSSFNTAQLCSAISTVTATFNLLVRAAIPGSCSIVANDLAFGARSSLASAVDASTAIGLTCTVDTFYTVRLDGGLIGGAVATRSMGRNGVAPGVIGYQLFRDSARTLVWGNTAGSTVTGTGTGVASTLTVHGRVPAQATPAVGDYRDTVTATVEY